MEHDSTRARLEALLRGLEDLSDHFVGDFAALHLESLDDADKAIPMRLKRMRLERGAASSPTMSGRR